MNIKAGDTIIVRYEWFRDPGSVGGGFWLQEQGTVVSIDTDSFTLKVQKETHVIPFSSFRHLVRI